MISRVLGTDSATVKVAAVVPPVPSAIEMSSTVRLAVSSSTIVPVPWPSSIVAPAAPLSSNENVSSSSSSVSPTVVIFTVRLVTPGANVTVPAAAA